MQLWRPEVLGGAKHHKGAGCKRDPSLGICCAGGGNTEMREVMVWPAVYWPHTSDALNHSSCPGADDIANCSSAAHLGLLCCCTAFSASTAWAAFWAPNRFSTRLRGRSS